MNRMSEKVSKFFSRRRNILVVVVGIFVLAAIPVTYKLVSEEQDMRQDAAGRQAVLLGKTYEESLRDKNIPAASSVLEVSMSYQASGNPSLSVIGSRVVQGYVPNELVTNPEYSLQVQDARGKVLSSTPFVVPDHVSSPPPLDGQSAESEVILPNVNFVVTVPYSDQASRVVVVDSGGRTVASTNITNVQKVNNKPAFRSVRGDVFLESGGRDLNLKVVPQASAASNNGVLDIAFIGDDYASNDAFQSDAVKFASKLLGFEPFKSRASQINFHYVENASDLKCKYDAVVTRLIVCDPATVMQKLNDSGVPYDEVVVILNNSTYGGSGSDAMAVSYNGSRGDSVFVHEFGHSFGGLLDEYTEGKQQSLSNATFSNCYAGIPPSSAWVGIVADNSYFQGCKYENWYRSSEDSIMRHVVTPYFNEVSKRVLNKKLDEAVRISNVVTPVPLTPTPASGLPKGYLDVASCATIEGWTCDPDSPGKSLNVHIYRGGPYGSGGTYVGQTVANLVRSDVASVCGGTSAHGYSFAVPASLKTGPSHSIYVHAINVDASGREGGVNPVLSNSGKVINCGNSSAPSTAPSKSPETSPTPTVTPTRPPKVTPTSAPNVDPKGNFESASCTKFVGWTCDPNKYSAPLKVHFYRDAPYGAKESVYIGQTTAGLKRTDVASVCGNTTAHGWSYVPPASLKDGKAHKIYAYPINILASGVAGGENKYVFGSPKAVKCN